MIASDMTPSAPTFTARAAAGESPAARERAPSAAAANRLPAVDVLRFASVLAIVWFHVGTAGRSYAYLGLPTVLIITVTLAALSTSAGSFATAVRRRAGRLLVPWLFWSVIYGVVRWREMVRHHQTWSDAFTPGMLLGGPWDHLWYLPFAFFASLIVFLLRRRVDRLPRKAVCLGGVAIGVAMAIAYQLNASSAWMLRIHHPLAEFMFASAAIPLGLGIAAALRMAGGGRGWLIPLAAIFAGATVVAFALPQEKFQPYLPALFLVCVAFLPGWKFPAALLAGTDLALGVYLLHPLVITVTLNHWMDPKRTSTAIVGTLLTLAIVWLLQRTPIKRFL